MLYALGAAAAIRMGRPVDWAEYILGQAVVTSIQLMAQYLNEYYDREVDRWSRQTAPGFQEVLEFSLRGRSHLPWS